MTLEDGPRGRPTGSVTITLHKVQASPHDGAFVLGSDSRHGEVGYVALSRGRTANEIYIAKPAPPLAAQGLDIGATLARRLCRVDSRAARADGLGIYR